MLDGPTGTSRLKNRKKLAKIWGRIDLDSGERPKTEFSTLERGAKPTTALLVRQRRSETGVRAQSRFHIHSSTKGDAHERQP